MCYYKEQNSLRNIINHSKVAQNSVHCSVIEMHQKWLSHGYFCCQGGWYGPLSVLVSFFGLNGKMPIERHFIKCWKLSINMIWSSAIGRAKITVSHVLGCQKRVSCPIMFYRAIFFFMLVKSNNSTLNTLMRCYFSRCEYITNDPPTLCFVLRKGQFSPMHIFGDLFCLWEMSITLQNYRKQGTSHNVNQIILSSPLILL